MIDIKEYYHTLMLKRKSFFIKFLSEFGLNMMEIEILYFLKLYPDSNTFTKIQESKDYAKSHVSTAIATLVSEGYLSKEYAPNSKKVFNLKLQEKSELILTEYQYYIDKFNQVIFDGISKADIDTFQSVIVKIAENLNQELGE